MQKEIAIQKEISTPVQQAENLEIKKNEDLTTATELLSTINRHVKKVSAEKDKVVKPLNEALKAERARWRPLENELSKALDTVRVKMSSFQTKQVEKENEEKNKIASDGRLTMDTAIQKMSEVETTEDKVVTSSGAVTFKTDYEIVVNNIEEVPFKFLKAEIRKSDIKSFFKVTGKQIPGVTIKEIQVPVNKI